MYKLILLFFIVLPFGVASQNEDTPETEANPRYFEDQFYFGVTYNFLLKIPIGVDQRRLSYGLQGGFIKDIPLNYKRTVGIGIGMGFELNNYYSNMRASQAANEIQYTVIEDSDVFKRSKLETHSIAIPIEFRWRNSTATSYKFWRLYTGIKVAYVFDMRSKYVSTNNQVDSFSNPDARKLQYGLTFNFGYNSFNAHIYYSLTNLLNDTVILEQNSINMKPLRVGLIFYFL